ncbi:MAG TPA: XdhC family protein [Gemmataceae bacterium]|nr:XdhC family protein [Gemmataceae bacterium]
MRDLLADLTAVLDQGRDCVYCCLVETRGSTPQKAGAAMLVFPDGGQRGTLGGGCVEAEVKRRALATLHSGGGPDVLTFHLDDDYGWDDGLICGGRMAVLADPFLADRRRRVADYYRRFHRLAEAGGGCTEAVVIDSGPTGLPPASRYLFDADGRLAAQLADAPPPAELTRHLPPADARPRPAVHRGVAFLPLPRRVTLLIVGGGHVGMAVAKLASEVDFDVWVLDDRERFANPERFPTARRLFVGDIGTTLKELVRRDIDRSTFCIIVTRGHAHDEEALYHLAPLTLPAPPPAGEGLSLSPAPPPAGEGRVRGPVGYVGMIGSKRKIKLIYEDLIARGVSEEALARVHAPLGFDIGSQTVPEIAVSIVAELISCRNKGATIPAARIQVRPGAGG